MVKKWVDCLWFSVFCSVHLGHDKKLWLIRALYAESLYWFFFGPSPSCNSRLKKIMQLCSCLDQSSKEDESSSAKTFYHWTPKDPARAFLYIGTSAHTPSIKFTTSLQLLRPGCNLGPLSNVTEQLLGPLVSRDLGFQICHYWSPTASPNLTPHELQGLQSHARDRWHIAKNHSCPLFWGRTDQVRGVLGPVTYWLWFYRKTWLGKAQGEMYTLSLLIRYWLRKISPCCTMLIYTLNRAVPSTTCDSIFSLWWDWPISV